MGTRGRWVPVWVEWRREGKARVLGVVEDVVE